MQNKKYNDRHVLLALIPPDYCPHCLNHRRSRLHHELCVIDNTPPKKENA
jgi:hypothetical protein